jgi:hypothetical protein
VTTLSGAQGQDRDAVSVALRRFQDILDHLEPQEDAGDLAGLADEIEDWAPLRRETTEVLLGGRSRKRARKAEG